ncbi:sensor histidine kinase [Microtetraspora malaysiensis]|uniref:sensor histidine kinase n=1 Tax=Microtetraspora malaysiensis TaxID=161358 RepID=UPI003D946B0F
MTRPRALPGRITLRARLTLIYSGLFLTAGLLLIGITYVLFNQQLSRNGPAVDTGIASSAAPTGPIPEKQLSVVTSGGDRLTGAAAEQWLLNQQDTLHEAAATSLITQGGLALLLVVGAATGSGWLVAGRVLAPLRQVTETARRIAGAPAADRGLHERIALRGPDDEVKDLADTFDTMVGRLDRSFDGQRLFVANASHELRTPLTLSRALIELAMHRRTASEDVKQLGKDLLEINSRHERLISGLLLLARSEHEITEKTMVDLEDVVNHVTAQNAAHAREAGVALREETYPAPTSGDGLLLERLVHNLVENGIRHNVGGDGAWVRVISRTMANGCVTVEVSNTGPAVPPYEIASLFEPFRRAGGDRLVTAKGVGLGLSIVRSIARAHGGDVTARPREGGGMTVTVTLPCCPEDERTETVAA